MSVFNGLIGRKTCLSLLLAPLGFAAWGSAQAATTYHVRTDGGDASQCTGRADAPYPGSGTGKACAWKHPFFALSPGGTRRIAGGDTLVIGKGSYMMGKGAPGAGSCSANSCFMAPAPSGTSTARTRIIGKAGSTPKLWGTGGVSRVLNLQGSSNVEVSNLEITDQSDCVSGHSNSSAACSGGAYASNGLYASDSSNVLLSNLNIHGLAHTGLKAGRVSNWTLDKVRINANGRAGWDGNVGSDSSNSGAITLRNVEIGWNGCGERWQTGTPWACWGEQTGGYGDGLGMYWTAGKWLIEDSFIHHNTSDGLDLRYMDGADGTHVTVRRSYFQGNAGNQAKIRGNSLIENSVLIGDCAYFEGKYDMVKDDNCRANGNSLVMVMTPRDSVVVRHNTITGEGGVLMGTVEGDSSGKVLIQNNLLVGFKAYPYTDGRLAALFYANSAPAPVTYSGNLVWNVKSNACPSGSICGQNPRLTNMSLDTFDAELLSGSPAIDKAPMISAVTSDFVMGKRPTGAANDVGAYEFGAAATTTPSPPPPVTREAKRDDFNGDGIADILWRNLANGANAIWKSANRSATQSTSGEARSWNIVGKGDFNGDGKADILWRNNSTGNNSIWKSGNRATSQSVKGVANKYWQVVGIGDFNADGRDDILWRNMLSGANTIWKSANASTQQPLGTVSNLAWKIVGVGDFNGDGRSDILWRSSSTGANSIWLSGNSRTIQGIARVSSRSWQVKGVGDFNGDGKSDILWRNASTGTNAIWKSGAHASPQAITAITDPSWHMVAVADYNGDGKDDILWRHRISGVNVVWLAANRANTRSIGAVTSQSWTVM